MRSTGAFHSPSVIASLFGGAILSLADIHYGSVIYGEVRRCLGHNAFKLLVRSSLAAARPGRQRAAGIWGSTPRCKRLRSCNPALF
jgi:hypothetical protein